MHREFMNAPSSAEISEEQAAKRGGEDPTGLGGWVQKLGDAGMAVFAHTARDISHVSDSRESSAAELARVVLQDAAMTAKLLRVANSPVFNPMGKSISTVSRAVVVLGFQEVRSICLSIAVVESMLKGKQKQRVAGEMARSFHAAVQARAFARKRKDKSPEEVFIATLLSHLGDMAFWAFAGDSAERMDTALRQRADDPPDKVQQDVLGFVFRELTLSLGREWKLGDLLEESLEGRVDKNPRAGSVLSLRYAFLPRWVHALSILGLGVRCSITAHPAPLAGSGVRRSGSAPERLRTRCSPLRCAGTSNLPRCR